MGKNNVTRLDDYGRTEREQEMNLHDYNHALFQNMMFFMDAVWEINMLTGTVVILRDKSEPEEDVRELVYEEVYQEYLTKRIMEDERDIFRYHMATEELAKLEEEISFDIRLLQKNGEWELHRIVLTPAFGEDGRLYSVYFGIRNLQMEVSRELAEYHNQKQFRDALIANSYFHLDFDLDGDGMIRRDFMTRDGVCLISRITGMELPVSFETFVQKWYEVHDPWFDKQEGKEIFTEGYLRRSYARSERLINMEVKQKVCGSDGMPEYLQIFIVLLQDIENEHIHANIIWRDVSAFHKEAVEDNRKLQDSNQELQRTISQEQQFRQSVLSGAVLCYEINLTKNRIEEEFYETIDGKQYPMLELVGLTAPCSFDEFCKRWGEQKVSEESRETFLRTYNRTYMLEAYEKGERQLELEFVTILARGIPMTLRNTALLVEDNESGDIIAMVNGKDVTAQRQEEIRQREALKTAYEAANQASLAKSDFLVRLSHDIRTPMNTIIGMTAIAERHQDNAERVEDCLKRISFSAKYLLALVDEMLDMSMIEAGRMEFKEEEVNLEEQFENLCVLLQMQAKEKEHNFNGTIGELEHKSAYGDRRRIAQIMVNLVDNAIKYTEEKGEISLTLNERQTGNPGIGCYEFAVEDNGIGIEPELMDHLYEPFVRSKDRRVEKIQGSGLGLAITKNIICKMDGSIDVESEPGRGTKVTVRIYLRLPAEENAASEETPADSGAGEENAVSSFTDKDFSGHRVLVVEDNESNAEILGEILRMVGLEVEYLWNGKEAVDRMAIVEDGYYDMIFMDIIMPMMDGHDATRAIRNRNRDYLKKIPIIAMSANAYEEDVCASLAAGMNEHLTKPVDLKSLGKVLTKFLAG